MWAQFNCVPNLSRSRLNILLHDSWLTTGMGNLPNLALKTLRKFKPSGKCWWWLPYYILRGCSRMGGVHGCSRGACVVAPGGVRGCSWGGACVVAPGGACWLLLGGMHGCSGGMRGCSRGGACVVARGGVHGFSMRYGQWAGSTHPTGMHSCYRDTMHVVFLTLSLRTTRVSCFSTLLTVRKYSIFP